MKTHLDLNKIAKALGANRRGKVKASGGYVGAMQVVGVVAPRLRVPPGGGRPTDPNWTQRRLLPLAPRTLKRLEQITARIREHGGAALEPMQLAALLLETTTERITEDETESLVAHLADRPRRPRNRTGASAA